MMPNGITGLERVKRNLYAINYNRMRTQWTTKGNRDASSSCSYGDTLPHTVVGICGEFQRTGRFLRGIWSQCVVPRSAVPSVRSYTLATPRQDWTGSKPSRREGRGCGFTLSRSHSCCAVRLVYTQISPGHIWTTLYLQDQSKFFTLQSKYHSKKYRLCDK